MGISAGYRKQYLAIYYLPKAIDNFVRPMQVLVVKGKYLLRQLIESRIREKGALWKEGTSIT